ncbi:capsular exopolysaccharide synthesis family protein [Flavobacterium sp. 1]|uniref:GumC family protein n=1 Tax=Flavobacterium sp. 1 TaxID=2035200 RepID=UPI000C24DE20|nr:polysaccharide biosynthesis tyrosine autokinase [Flavobacterium sp. 1]PJJ11121.1 capsular exopolysaccharide synthesis family protein [Flavobacterium sp. 1]
MENNNYSFNDDLENDFDLKAFFDKYLIHWKWFGLGVGVSLIFAFLYLRYTIPLYQASTTILVKDEKKGGMLSELSAFADIGGIAGGMKSNVDNEIEILKSRTLIENTVKKLNLTVSIVFKGKITDNELYKEAPIEVILVNPENHFYKSKMNLNYKELTSDTFELKKEPLDENSKIYSTTNRFHYGELITTRNGQMIINKTKSISKNIKESDRDIIIVISPLEDIADSFRNRLTVNPISKTSSVVEIFIKDPVVEKAEDFLDNLIAIYNSNAATDKNFIAENTSEFINNRLEIITQELDGVEKNVESFKTSNKVTDIESEAKLYVEGSEEYVQKGAETEIQLNVVSSMLGFINKSTSSDLLPANLISGQGDASGLIDSYNTLVLDRNRILKSATPENPSVIKLDQQIASLKANVKASLLRIQSNLTIQKNDLKQSEGILNAKIGKIPVKERQFKVIARQQKVKEELYLYLLQKREETAISLAATEPNARVIDAGKALKTPVSPKKNIIYLVALLLGLLIPFGIIYVIDLLDTKIKSRLDLEGKTMIPFVGDVPSSDSPSEIIKSESRTSSAEALRIIRTNLEFILSKADENSAKTIFLTSTFPKEGKTFVSANLAGTFALSGKKVLLIGMDIRNPRLDEYFALPERGFTNYLSSKDLKLEDLIVKQDGFDNFYILPAGVIPPNPAELLMSNKVDDLFKTLRAQYDYIIVDTAPVSLVTDTLLVAKHADCFIYVARANFLEKRMLNIPNELYKANKLPNMCLLLNDTDSTKGYGYGYGYGVNIKKASWYDKIWRK